MSNKLINAAKEGNLDNVKLLLNNGAEVDAKDNDDMTALMWAALYGHTEVVKLLLENGAQKTINEKDDDNKTALIHACIIPEDKDFEKKDVTKVNSIVKLLLEKDAKVDAQDKFGMTALKWASRNGAIEAVKLLIEKNADVNITPEFLASTPLMLASENGHKEVVKTLIEQGAEVDAKDKDNGMTPLMWASEKGHKEVVETLLNYGAKVDAVDNNGTTALMWASENGKTDVVKTLLNNGADINVQADGNNTALTLAEENKEIQELLGNAKKLIDEIKTEKPSLETINPLLTHVNFKYDGKTPLMWASFKGHTEVVEALLGVKWGENKLQYIKIEGRDEKSIADVNLKDPDGFTALMYASRNGHTKVVEALLGVKWDGEKNIKIEGRDEKSIADVNLKDEEPDGDGFTALDYASGYNHNDVVKILEAEGALKTSGGGKRRRKSKRKKTKRKKRTKRRTKSKRKHKRKRTKRKRTRKHKKSKHKRKRKRTKRKHKHKKR